MNLHNAEFVRSVTSVADCPKDGLPQIAFAGKSNVGKSSVINKLLLRKNFARVGEAPGKTTHINFFRIDEAMYLVDLPGYGYAKVPQKEKERWGRLMEAYFAAPATLTFGVMLVDARHAPTANDVVMANYFLQSGKPFVVVANKLDKLKKSEIESNLARIREVLSLPDDVRLIPFSAEKGDGRDELLTVILHAEEQKTQKPRPRRLRGHGLYEQNALLPVSGSNAFVGADDSVRPAECTESSKTLGEFVYTYPLDCRGRCLHRPAGELRIRRKISEKALLPAGRQCRRPLRDAERIHRKPFSFVVACARSTYFLSGTRKINTSELMSSR